MTSDSIFGDALTDDMYPHVTDIQQSGPQSVQVVTRNHRVVRITAARVLRGPSTDYTALYDEQKDTGWLSAHFPAAHGESVADCLRAALHLVDVEGAAREDRWR